MFERLTESLALIPASGVARRAAAVVVASACGLFVGGCAQPAGQIFTPLAKPMHFPPAPDEPRLTYVGSLQTDADLKPAKSPLASFGEALFGQNSVNSMLSPYAVWAHGDRVWVCDSSAQVVHLFDLATRVYEQWRPDAPPSSQPKPPTPQGPSGNHGFSQPVGITGDSRGRILVADSVAGTIFVFDPTGHCQGEIGHGSLQRPCGLAFDATNDRLFIADAGLHQVVVMSLDGTLLAVIGTRGPGLGEFNFPTNVALGADGTLFVSDSLNFRVQVFDRDFKPIRQIGRLGDMPGYFAQPKGIAVDSEQHLYVVDSQFEAVQLFDLDGQLLMSFGDEGSGPGQFWLPAGIFIDVNDRVWIADSYNRRVQVFDYRSKARQAAEAASALSDGHPAPTEDASEHTSETTP